LDSRTLLTLAQEAVEASFNARWLPEHLTGLSPSGPHFLVAVNWHNRRPDDPPHLRCYMVLTMNDGARTGATIDVRAETFAALPATTESGISAEDLFGISGPTLPQWLDEQGAGAPDAEPHA
jgi:hypothetical protein